MVIVSPLSRVVSLANGLNGLWMGVTKQSLTGMILQVGDEILIQTYQQKFFWGYMGPRWEAESIFVPGRWRNLFEREGGRYPGWVRKKTELKFAKTNSVVCFSCRFNNRSTFSIGEGLLKLQLIKVSLICCIMICSVLSFYDFCQWVPKLLSVYSNPNEACIHHGGFRFLKQFEQFNSKLPCSGDLNDALSQHFWWQASSMWRICSNIEIQRFEIYQKFVFLALQRWPLLNQWCKIEWKENFRKLKRQSERFHDQRASSLTLTMVNVKKIQKSPMCLVG